MPETVRVAVAGAAGRMGSEVVRAVSCASDLTMCAAVDPAASGRDAGDIAGLGSIGVPIAMDVEEALASSDCHVLVDFTVPAVAKTNVMAALRIGVAAVVGTTGLTASDLAEFEQISLQSGASVLVAPNFAIGAILMMQFAAQAARYLPDAEILELHHDRKLDSPSGTALLTAQRIASARQTLPTPAPVGLIEKVPGARGATSGDVHIHSVRLQGLVAHQEVIFGGPGQTLTIRHDSLDRQCFMPGVLLAIRSVRSRPGLTVGLEGIL